MQVSGHTGLAWLPPPAQLMGNQAPHSLARMLMSQAESSGTATEVVQREVTHCAMSRVPWQADGTSQLGARRYDAGQSFSLAQQSPPVQQKPLPQ